MTTGIRAEGAGIGTLGYWVLALAFMLQLYYDFSGYSDIAIGLGKILRSQRISGILLSQKVSRSSGADGT